MAEVGALEGEWDDLLARAEVREIFRSFAWLATWWEVFGDPTRAPLVIGVRDGKTLVGLAPFVVRDTGPARGRRLQLMGTGEDEADEVGSDFLDVVAARGYEDQVASAVWRRLHDERPRWDEAVFRNLAEESLLARFVQAMAKDYGFGQARRPSGERFWVDLAGADFSAYVAGLSKKKQKRVSYYRRRLEKDGDLVARRIEDAAEIPDFLAEVARLSCLRRGALGKPSAWQSAKFRRFHALLAPRLQRRGQLDLRLWTRGGRAVAALYNFLYDGAIYYYQSGFDTEAFGNVSPGLVTITQVIEWGFAQRLRRFDFLVGGDGSYKEDYACQTEPVVDLDLYGPTWRGRLLGSARGWKDYVKQARALRAGDRDAHPV